jgi:putative oxidoreductase
MHLGTAALRGIVGPLFVGHGTQKLFGWFDGPGLDATAGGFEQMGLRPGRRHAVAGGAAEALGGVLLTLGALTPLAGSLITGAMTTAIRKVHAPNGPWVDDKLFPNLPGPFWAALAVGSGVAGSYLITEKLTTAPETTAPEMGAGDPASPNGAAQPEPASAGA